MTEHMSSADFRKRADAKGTQPDRQMELIRQCNAEPGVPEPVAEFRFHPKRWWRFDLAWPMHKVALEIEGGAFVQGRHTRGAGYEKDCEKYSEAAVLGWRILRVLPDAVPTGKALALIRRVFA